MRRALALAGLLPAACGSAGAPDNGGAAAGTRIECRLEGSDRFAPVCSLESAERSDGLVLTLRKPDGGFRRLLLANNDGGLIADGAEQADIALLGDGRIEVAIGGESFRLPAAAGR